MMRSLRANRSLRNPLIQRVRRHASVSTLFRSPQDQDFASSQPQVGYNPTGTAASEEASGGGPARLPLVSASLLPAAALPGVASELDRSQESLDPGDLSRAQPAAHLTPESRAVASQPSVQRREQDTIQDAPAAVSQPQVVLPPPQPEPQNSEDENRIWNRLQAIFRKHQEKQAEAEAVDVEDATVTADESSPSAGASQPAGVQAEREEESVPLHDQSPAGSRDGARATIQENPLPASQDQPAAVKPSKPGAVQEKSSFEQVPGDQEAPAVQRQSALETQSGDEPSFGQPTKQPAVLPPPSPPVSPLAGPPLDIVETSDQPLEPSSQLPDTEMSAPKTGELPAESRQALEAPILPRPAGGTDLGSPSAGESEMAATSMVQKSSAEVQASAPNQPKPDAPAQPQVMETPPGERTQLPAEPADRMPSQAPAARSLPLPPDVYAPAGEADSEFTQELQAAPLESAWQVQRMPEQLKPETEIALPPPMSGLASSPEAHQVSSLLQNVSPGQPTDSQVEVVTPRRPRPAVPASAQAKASPAAPPPSADQVSRLPEVDSEAARPLDRPEDSLRPPMVETEIGTLPADLWHLIGQEPPQPQASQPAQGPLVQRQPGAEAGSLPVDTAGRQAQVTAHPAAPIVTYQISAPVQRAEAADAAPAAAAGEGAEGEAADGGLNMDELSRRVYQEVKRRLENEWERMRRRF